MRQFLNTLFVLNESAYLSLDGENVVVSCDKAEVGRVALHTLESILCFSYAGASPALMGKCGRLGIDLCFFSPQGRFLARTVGEEQAPMVSPGASHCKNRHLSTICFAFCRNLCKVPFQIVHKRV